MYWMGGGGLSHWFFFFREGGFEVGGLHLLLSKRHSGQLLGLYMKGLPSVDGLCTHFGGAWCVFLKKGVQRTTK